MTDERFLKLVGKRIRDLRLAKGLTQERIAHDSHVDYKYYQRIEHGDKNLSLTSLRKLAKVLGVAPWQLIKTDDD